MSKQEVVKQKELAPKKAAKAEKKRSRSLDVQKSRMGWVFIAPFLIGFIMIYLPMIIESITFSFTDMVIQKDGGYILNFVGFENYRQALTVDAQFSTTLISSIKELLFNVPAIVIFSLFMAVILNQKMRGRAIFRAIFFIPVIVSTGIIESIDLRNSLAENMVDTAAGTTGGVGGTNDAETGGIVSALDIQRLFAGMAIGGELVSYVTTLINDVYDIVNKSGVQMLIFLAGLQSISPAIYESCYIDGASSWETFWKITFPMISPMILVNAVYTVIDAFTAESNAVMSYISQIYTDGKTEISTAMAWIYFIIVVAILAAVAGLLSAYVFYQRKDV